MKRPYTVCIVVCVLLLLLPAAYAAPSKDERNLDKEIAGLDRVAADPAAEQVVLDRIEKEFRTVPAQVHALRARGLGYGEIVAALSLARMMPGGITDSSVDRILALRAGPPPAGWGAVAKQLGIKLGPAVTQVRKIVNEVLSSRKQPAVRPAAAAPQGTPAQGKGPRLDFSGEGKSLPQGRAAD